MNKSYVYLTLLCLQLLFFDNLHEDHKFSNHQISKSEYHNIEAKIILLSSISKNLSKDNNYSSYSLVKAKKRNKNAHIKNGNRNNKKVIIISK